MNSECITVLESAAGYADGSLKKTESDRVTRHLAACPSCRKAFETERRLRQDLSALPRQRCPGRVTDSIMRSIGSGGRTEATSWWRIIRSRRRTFKPAFAAALVLALSFGVWEWMRPPRRPDPAFSEAEVKLADTALEWSLAFAAHTIRQSEKQALESVFVDPTPDAPLVKSASAPLKPGGTVK